MGVEMQLLFRKYNHIRGYYGEIMLAIVYTIYAVFLLYNYIFRPLINLLITTSDFQCSEIHKNLWFIGNLCNNLSVPLSAQIVFFAVMN